MPALWLISSLFHVYKLTWTAFSESLMKHIVVLSSHHAFFLSVTAINKLNRNWRTMRVLLLVVFRRPGERAPHWGNSRMVQWDVDWVPAGVGGGGGSRMFFYRGFSRPCPPCNQSRGWTPHPIPWHYPWHQELFSFCCDCDQWHSQRVQQALTCPARVSQKREGG